MISCREIFLQMKFKKIEIFPDYANLKAEKFDIGFFGDEIDDRGRTASTYTKDASSSAFHCRWDKTDLIFCVDKQGEFKPYELSEFFKKLTASSVLIEATTLGFVEILYIVSALNECPTVSCINFLYIEPEQYNELDSVESPLPHSFSLSKSLGQLIPLPGFTKNFVRKNFRTHLMAFLGFEASRLGRVLEDDEGAGISKFSVGIGIPAFVPGWENHTMDCNIAYLDHPSREDITFFSANNPQTAFDAITAVAESLGEAERIVIAPFGTKPAGIGAIIYAVANPEMCGIIYDHPLRQKDRSKGVGRCHLFQCEKIQ